MTVALGQLTTAPGRGKGGAPARRALARWAWRLFRREWRQQSLVLTLLVIAVATTTVSLALITKTVASHDRAEFGSANHILTLQGSPYGLRADLARARARFGTVEVITHHKVAIPGSAATVDLRGQDPHGPYGAPMLRLDAGRYPAGGSEVAVTHRVASIFGLHPGGVWRFDGRSRRIVGIVENPQNLADTFALAAPGPTTPATTTALLLRTSDNDVRGFRFPSGAPADDRVRGPSQSRNAAITVLVVTTVGFLFIGLLAVGAFAVLAARRQRALGMLGAIGATDRQVRLVVLANGAVVGIVGAGIGAALGLAAWLAFAPRLEPLIEQRVARFALPWWAIGADVVLAVLTALGAAWWPARAAARVSIVTALSGRPPRPQPARAFAALGGLLIATGAALLVIAEQRRPIPIVAGILAATLGVLLLAPLTVRGLSTAARRAPFAVRLALRDLGRYQARSGASVGAITLAVGIAATIAISAASAGAAAAAGGGNLPADQLVATLTGSGHEVFVVPTLTPAQQQSAQARVGAIAAALGSHDVLPLQAAIDPSSPTITPGDNGTPGKFRTALARVTPRGHGFEVENGGAVYVATAAVLAHYGIRPGIVDPAADLLSSRTGLTGLQLFAGKEQQLPRPKVQTVRLPTFSAAPNTLITAHGMRTLGVRAVPVAWLVQAPRPLTQKQIDAVTRLAAAAGLTVETRPTGTQLNRLRTDTTAAGVLLALGVLAMSVGLLRSETAANLRTLAAAGASSTTRRALTSATAGALALQGAWLGVAGSYLALLAWHHRDLHALAHVPVADLVAVLVGMPAVAALGGWLLAGRQPPAIARQPIE